MSTKPMNRNDKEQYKLIAESIELCKTMSLMIYGFGRCVTMMSFKPKNAAAHMMKASEEFTQLSNQTFELAEKIIEWNDRKLIVAGKTLVGVDLKPIES